MRDVVLAGLVFGNLLVPRHPAIFGTWPFVSDLRTGAMTGHISEDVDNAIRERFNIVLPRKAIHE